MYKIDAPFTSGAGRGQFMSGFDVGSGGLLKFTAVAFVLAYLFDGKGKKSSGGEKAKTRRKDAAPETLFTDAEPEVQKALLLSLARNRMNRFEAVVRDGKVGYPELLACDITWGAVLRKTSDDVRNLKDIANDPARSLVAAHVELDWALAAVAINNKAIRNVWKTSENEAEALSPYELMTRFNFQLARDYIVDQEKYADRNVDADKIAGIYDDAEALRAFGKALVDELRVSTRHATSALAKISTKNVLITPKVQSKEPLLVPCGIMDGTEANLFATEPISAIYDEVWTALRAKSKPEAQTKIAEEEVEKLKDGYKKADEDSLKTVFSAVMKILEPGGVKEKKAAADEAKSSLEKPQLAIVKEMLTAAGMGSLMA